MRRINSSTASPNLHGVGRPGFVEGSIAQQIPTTHFTPEWCNSVQEEIARAIEIAGITLNPASNEQLAAAVYGKRVLNYSGPVNSESAFGPAGWSEADVVFINATGGNGQILGFAPSVLKPHKRIFASGVIPLQLSHNSTSAPAGNRCVTQNGLSAIIALGLSADIALATPNGAMSGLYGQAWYVSNYQSLIHPFTEVFNAPRLGPNAELLYANESGTPTPRGRDKQLFHFHSQNPSTNENALTYAVANGYFLSVASGYAVFPIDLPAGCVINGVSVGMQAPTGTISVSAWKDRVTWGDGSVLQEQNGSTLTTSGTGYHSSSIVGFVPETIVAPGDYLYRYYVRIGFSASAQTIRYIRVAVSDPGPRTL